jgi:hypothetical protein
MEFDLRQRVVVEESEEPMVLPHAIDLEIPPSQALILKPRPDEKSRRSLVLRQACRFEPMKTQNVEHEPCDRANSPGHVSLPGVRSAYPVPERTALAYATPNIAERQAAD